MTVIRDYYLDMNTGTVRVRVPNHPKTREPLSSDLEQDTIIGHIVDKRESCKTSVGAGAKVHHGFRVRYEFDQDLSIWNGPTVTPGQQKTTEPFVNCGTTANHFFNGMVTFTRNGNIARGDDEEVTCTKCLKREATKSR